MRNLFKFLFKLFGYKVVGKIPDDLKKGVLAVCPHNSNKDFFIGLGTRAVMNRKIGYLGKEELFKPPFGFIFKGLGGTAVVRNKNSNLVQDYIKTINENEEMMFALAPEGTRKQVEKLKTGFYYIAHGAKIPIIRIAFDLSKKVVTIAEPFMPSGNFKEDMQNYFVPFFEKVSEHKNWVSNYKKGIFE